ncbi:MAG: hypothetical protein ACYC5S_03075 [Thiobacillus sp.]
MAVGPAQAFEQLAAQRAHRRPFEPAVGRAPQHDDDFRAVFAAQPFFEPGTDAQRREVLVLDVDQLFRRPEHIEIKGLDFAHLGQAVVLGFGARDRDAYIDEIRGELLRPGITLAGAGMKPLTRSP